MTPVLAALGIACGILLLAWAIWTLAEVIVKGTILAVRSWKRARKVLADADKEMLGDLVTRPELDRYRAHRDATAEHQRCHRCRTGSLAWPCTCDHDCYADACQGWYADTARTVIKGDQ